MKGNLVPIAISLSLFLATIVGLGSDFEKPLLVHVNSHGKKVSIQFSNEILASLKKPEEAKTFIAESGICHPPVKRIGVGKYICSEGDPLKFAGVFVSKQKFKSVIKLAAKETE